MISLEAITPAYALNLTKTNMMSYCEKHGLSFREDLFLQNWDNADNFGIRYLPDDCVVGFMRMMWSAESTECYLKDLQIEPEFRNQGIGTACLQQVKTIAIDAGASVIRLRVFIDNPAIALYQRFGFVESDRKDGLIEMTMQLET